MNTAPKVPGKGGKKLPPISKFAIEPALPTGKSTIKVLKDTETRDLAAAAEDANKELSALSDGVKIKVVVNTPGAPKSPDNELGSLDEPAAPIADELIETSESEEANDPLAESPAAPKDDEPKAPAKNADDDGISDDPLTVKAVDDIIAEEADKLLEAEDEEREAFALAQAMPKQRNFLARALSRPGVRWGLFIVLAAGLLAAGLAPGSRYYALNAAGVRSSLELKVIDTTTQLPLKNVIVSAGGAAAQTDDNGIAKLAGVRLGATKLVIEKRAFSKIEKHITVGWGSNPLGEFQAKAIGAQYSFAVKDYLTGQPVLGAAAKSGDGDAIADKDGNIVLTLDTAAQEDDALVEVFIRADGYREERVEVAVSNREAQAVELVPARKHVFVSKRSGKSDVYTVDIDGKNEQKLVEGTGLERDDIALIPNAKEPYAALVTTRERVTNASGYLLSTLYLVDTSSGKLTKIDQSEKIQVAGWSKEGRLVYVKIASGAGGADPKRHRIMSFNSKDFGDMKELATANAFNNVLLAGERVYWSPSNAFLEDDNPGAFAIGVDGQDKQDLVTGREITVMQRNAYEALDLSDGTNWFTYALGSNTAAAESKAPAEQAGKLYVDNQGSTFSLWVEDRGGKGTLHAYDRTARKDSSLASISGLKEPMYWLSARVAVFRVKDSRETADYAVSLDGGEPRKITNTANTAGIDRLNSY
ncbi:MAG: hypothetical protein WAQ57_02840 [Candidatus Saccharimonadales bacterium]